MAEFTSIALEAEHSLSRSMTEHSVQTASEVDEHSQAGDPAVLQLLSVVLLENVWLHIWLHIHLHVTAPNKVD